MSDSAVTGAGSEQRTQTAVAGAASKRLLLCSTDFPHPSRGASMVVLYHYVLHFRRMGFDVLHVIPIQDRKGVAAEEAEYRSTMGDEGNFRITVHPVKALYEDRPNKTVFKPVRLAVKSAEIAALVGDFRPDVIFCFDILSAALVKDAVSGPKVVWLGDLNFQTFWYHAWYAFRERWIHARRLPPALINSRVWRRFYRDTLEGMASVIVCAKLSESALNACGTPSTYLPFPWPCEVSRDVAAAPTRAVKPTFLFLGNLVGLGSRSALHFLLGSLYRRLIEEWGRNGFEIQICGMHGLPPWVEKLVAAKPEIRYLGFVEDLENLMRQCHAVIAPIDVPVGNRTRILTAMAARVPAIAHGNTALGNPALIDGETCLLANDAKSFSLKMRRVFEDEAFSRAISEKAFESYRSLFNPETASAQMGDVLLDAMKGAMKGSPQKK
jgi:glycosyltransferase involved in cell wall biosynthesis